MTVRTQPRGGSLFALKALVGGMGVLIVLGTAVVIAVVVQRIYASPAAPSMTRPSAAPPFALPAGAHIAGIAGAGGAVAVWVTGAAGDELLLVDPATRQVSTVIAPPRLSPGRPPLE